MRSAAGAGLLSPANSRESLWPQGLEQIRPSPGSGETEPNKGDQPRLGMVVGMQPPGRLGERRSPGLGVEGEGGPLPPREGGLQAYCSLVPRTFGDCRKVPKVSTRPRPPQLRSFRFGGNTCPVPSPPAVLPTSPASSGKKGPKHRVLQKGTDELTGSHDLSTSRFPRCWRHDVEPKPTRLLHSLPTPAAPAGARPPSPRKGVLNAPPALGRGASDLGGRVPGTASGGAGATCPHACPPQVRAERSVESAKSR